MGSCGIVQSLPSKQLLGDKSPNIFTVDILFLSYFMLFLSDGFSRMDFYVSSTTLFLQHPAFPIQKTRKHYCAETTMAPIRFRCFLVSLRVFRWCVKVPPAASCVATWPATAVRRWTRRCVAGSKFDSFWQKAELLLRGRCEIL